MVAPDGSTPTIQHPPKPADRLAAYGPTQAHRTVRTLVACVLATDDADLTEAVNDRLAAIEDAGGIVASIAYAAAATMTTGEYIIEDRLSALIVYRTGRPA